MISNKPNTSLTDRALYDPLLKPFDKIVYWAISSHAYGNKTTANPGVDLIALITGIGETSVKESIQKLHDLKYIQKTRANKRAPNTYTIFKFEEVDTKRQVDVWKDEIKTRRQKKNPSIGKIKTTTSAKETISQEEAQVVLDLWSEIYQAMMLCEYIVYEPVQELRLTGNLLKKLRAFYNVSPSIQDGFTDSENSFVEFIRAVFIYAFKHRKLWIYGKDETIAPIIKYMLKNIDTILQSWYTNWNKTKTKGK